LTGNAELPQNNSEMKCPKCSFDQPAGGTECIKCGIVFTKYLTHLTKREAADDETLASSGALSAEGENHRTEQMHGYCRELFFYVTPEAGIAGLTGRTVLLAVLLWWGLKLIFSSVESNYSGESFLHLINLPFHEAGHILFRAFGQFMMAVGGSLTQMLVPLVCLSAFIFKTRDTFGASVSLWWLGENLIDLAPYINDARDLKLMLLGGVTGKDVEDYHDWEFILRKLGLLEYDHLIAKTSHAFGAILMGCAVIWGGFLLLKQFRNRRSEKEM
jgi:hypothetical protein